MEIAKTHSNTVELAALLTLIEQSALLTPEQKEKVRAFAVQSDEVERGQLSALLATEAGVVQTMVSDAVRIAASQGDNASVIKKFDEFFRQAERHLSKSKESVEHDSETTSAASLLDAA